MQRVCRTAVQPTPQRANMKKEKLWKIHCKVPRLEAPLHECMLPQSWPERKCTKKHLHLEAVQVSPVSQSSPSKRTLFRSSPAWPLVPDHKLKRGGEGAPQSAYQHHLLHQLRPFLGKKELFTVTHALISSWLGGCNTL